MEKSERIKWLDATKGIGMLMIMLTHMDALSWGLQYLIAGYVAMFFVASGISLKIKPSITDGIRKKTHRLLIPYAFYTTCILLATLAMSLLTGKDIDIGRKIAGVIYSRYLLDPANPTGSLLLNGGNAPLWFLTSLYTSYLLVYLWQWLKQSNYVLIAYLILSVAMTQIPILLPWSIDMAPLGALLIIAGMKGRDIMSSPKYDVWLPAITACYVLIVYLNGVTNMSLRNYGDLGMISALLFIPIGILEFWIIAILCRLTEHTRAAAVAGYIGRSSLRLMCIHMFIWLSFKDIILSRLGDGWHLPLVALSLIVIFVVNHVIGSFRSQVPVTGNR